MKAPQQWRLERMVYDGFYEEGMRAARRRQSDSDPAVKAFVERVPQVADPVLTLLRFEAFVRGWDSTIEFDREEQAHDTPDQSLTDFLESDPPATGAGLTVDDWKE